MGDGKGRRTRRALAIAAGALSLTLLSGVGTAAARKIVHQAKVWDASSTTYIDGHLIKDYRLKSTNRRCIDRNAVSDVDVRFYFYPDPEYATGDGSFTNAVQTEESFFFTRIGLGWYRLRLPGSQTVSTTNYDGSYGGTYSFEKWWNDLAIGHATSKLYIGSHLANGQVSKQQGNWDKGPPRAVIYFKKRRNGKKIKHVVKCGSPIITAEDESTRAVKRGS